MHIHWLIHQCQLAAMPTENCRYLQCCHLLAAMAQSTQHRKKRKKNKTARKILVSILAASLQPITV